MIFGMRFASVQENHRGIMMEMEIIAGVVGFVILVLLMRLMRSEGSRQRGGGESHCFSIKNIRYTMMDSDR